MTWDNHGKKKTEWNIDEIRPVSSFDLTKEEQQKVCFNWRNRQPLWWKDNNSKWAKYELGDEVDWVRHMQAHGYEGELFLKYEEGNSY